VLIEGVRAIIQPGGSISDFEGIEACNEADATMVFTKQRMVKPRDKRRISILL